MKIYFALLYCLFTTSTAMSANNKHEPELLLARIYHAEINIENYWVSEKLDGVRAYWNGHQLISRQGNVFNAPEWFTQVLPAIAFDGELWLARGKFDELSGRVRRQQKSDVVWQGIKYMIFDMPDKQQNFDQRLKQLKRIITGIDAAHIVSVKQVKVADHKSLHQKLDQVVNSGGEGLMLQLGNSYYKSGRNNDLLKLKKYADAEATVIKQLPGKGKYQGMLGSLLVETEDNRRFKIGTGFTDEERKHPPAPGTVITYKYSGLTKTGLPRFASFLRIRNIH